MKHKIVSGDTLSGIAYKYGIKSWKTIWDAKENADFQIRCNGSPGSIVTGDYVFIPTTKVSSTASSVFGTSSGSSTPSTKPAATKTKPSTAPATPPAVTTTAKTTAVAKKDPAYAGSNTHKGIMKAAEVLKCGAAAIPKYIEFLVRITGSSVDEIGDALDFLGKRADGLEFIVESYKASVAFGAHKHKLGCISLMKAVGKGWKVLPKPFQYRFINGLARMLRRIPKLKDVGDLLIELNRYHVVPHTLILIAAIWEGKGLDARNATKDLVEGLKQHPTSITLSYNFSKILLGWLPASVQDKLLAKIAGRKIPVLGTVIVACFDMWAIYEAENNPEASEIDKWVAGLGLASTAAGLVPGAGTVVSVIIDLAIIIMTCIEEAGDLGTPKSDPTI